jgi:hypothetical protein
VFLGLLIDEINTAAATGVRRCAGYRGVDDYAYQPVTLLIDAAASYKYQLEIMEEDPLGEQVKTVYAHFGLAMYLAQVLEHGLANSMLIFELVPVAGKLATPDTWSDKVDLFYETQFRRTLGQLIQRLKAVTEVPGGLEESLARALEKRNWLAHHYFRERAEECMSTQGRERMIAELEEAQSAFSDADAALEKVSKPVRERFGYTEKLLSECEEEMLKRARSDL